jgi:hypothetical protein
VAREVSKAKRKPAADEAQALAARSQASQKTKGSDTKNDGPNGPLGRNTTKAERRLRKDRPDLYALRQLLRSDRKRTGGWVRLGKLKGAYA